ncbi:conserved hypothetical protein [delta proteobacterium NaphS2]|nr:conserved hypothetical protein [delta proteobacterium NaphS2]
MSSTLLPVFLAARTYLPFMWACSVGVLSVMIGPMFCTFTVMADSLPYPLSIWIIYFIYKSILHSISFFRPSSFNSCPFKLLCIIFLAVLIPNTIEARATEEKKPVNILSPTIPLKMVFDFPYSVKVRVQNQDRMWPAGGKIRLSYHLLDMGGRVVAFNFERTYMPRDIAKGETIDLVVNVSIPKADLTPGKYLLQWDIVEEGVKWYYSDKLLNYSVTPINIVEKDLYGNQVNPGLSNIILFFLGVLLALTLPGILLAFTLNPEFKSFSLTQGFCCFTFCGIAFANTISVFFSLFSIKINLYSYAASILTLYICFLLIPWKRNKFQARNFYISKKWLHAYGLRRSMHYLFRELIYLGPAILCSALVISVWQEYITFPNIFDLSTHAAFIRKIYDGGLALGQQVFSSEVPWTVPEKGFYPLGLHRVVSIIAKTSGLNPVFALFYFIVFLFFCAPVMLQLFIQRYFFSYVHIFLIGLAVALFPIFPYEPISWGGAPLIAGTIFIPFLLYIIQEFFEKLSFKSALSVGLISGTLFYIHPSELYTVFLISIFLLLRKLASLKGDNLKVSALRIFAFGLIASGVFLFLIFPEIMQIIYTQLIRSSNSFIRVPDQFPLGVIFSKFILSPNDMKLLFLILGSGYIIFTKKVRFLLIIAGFFVVLALIENYVNTPFGNLWNHRVGRIYYNSYLFNPIFIGSGLYVIYRLFAYGDYFFINKLKSAFLFSIVGFFLFVRPEFCDTRAQLEDYFRRNSGMTSEDYDAVRWLDENISDNTIYVYVLNQHGDSSFWIYPFTGIPIFWHRTDTTLPYPDTYARVRFQQNIAAGKASELKAYARKYHLKYVYISRNIVPLENSPYKSFSIRFFDDNRDLFRLVYSNSTVRIYEIVGVQPRKIS